MIINIVKDDFGNEIVNIDNEDGTFVSMLKSVYDEMQSSLPNVEGGGK